MCSLVSMPTAIAGRYFGCRPLEDPVLGEFFNHCAVEEHFSAGTFQRWELIPGIGKIFAIIVSSEFFRYPMDW
jgi:hypothetical protein